MAVPAVSEKVYLPVRVTGPPVRGFPVTLGYMALWPPYYTADRPHLGTDWGAPHSTPAYCIYLNPTRVLAVHRVDAANQPLDGWGNGSLGNCIIFDIGYIVGQATEYYGCYAHMSRIDVKPGDIVTPGQMVGLTGDSGYTDGAHIHVQHSVDQNFSRDAKTEDPMRGLDVLPPQPSTPYVPTLADVAASLANLNAATIGIRDEGIERDRKLDTRLAGIEAALAAFAKALPKG